MRRTRIALAGLAIGMAASVGSAGAHDKGSPHRFPPLPPKSSQHALRGGPVLDRTMEQKVRRIETRALGSEHAMEHAQGRYLTQQAVAHYDLGSGKFSQVLQPRNNYVAANVGGAWGPVGRTGSGPIGTSDELPITAINAVMLHTGKILFFAYPWRATEPDPDTGEAYPDGSAEQLAHWNSADAYLYDPATGRSKAVPPPVNPDTGKAVELFCAGQSLMADGRVLITGGNVGNPAGDPLRNKENYGLDTTYVFDPDKAERGEQPWTAGPRMRQGRWYPSQLLMPDGRTVITSGQANVGDQDEHQVNKDVEVYYPDAGGGTLENLSGARLDGANGRPQTPGQYPHMLWLPSGGIFNYGPFKPDSWLMAAPLPGAGTTSFTDLPDLSPTNREWASGFQIPGGVNGSSKVMLVGGADRTDINGPSEAPALGSTTFFDESKPEQGWQKGADLKVARAFANAVVLPTGKVAVVGGGRGNLNDSRYYRWSYAGAGVNTLAGGDQRRVEILDPADATKAPVLGNAQAEGRTYHSTALLMPDGRVWSAGDDINGPRANPTPDPYGGPSFGNSQKLGGGSGVRKDTAEIWSPPYLFNADGSAAARPTMTAPRMVPWGEAFDVTSTDVETAVLVAPGATTHANDMSQRLVTLAKPERVSGSTLRFEGPSNENIAPPGWYMLFGLNAAGTPSVASWVYVGALPASIANPNPYVKPPRVTPGGGTSPGNPGTGTGTGTAGVGNQPPTTTLPPGANEVESTVKSGGKLELRVRLSVATTVRRLLGARRVSARIAASKPAKVTVTTGLESAKRVKGKTRKRTVVTRLAAARTFTLKRAGTRRVTVKLGKAALKRLRARRSVTLRIVVTAKPLDKGKAVRIVRRPVLR